MKLITVVLSMFAAVVMSGCLTETDDGDGSGGGDDEQPECVPFLTCGTPEETTSQPDPPDDTTWNCIPFVTC